MPQILGWPRQFNIHGKVENHEHDPCIGKSNIERFEVENPNL